ncbi:hypothetical protein CROQUDRAFT_131337 [Cronartium quercuum f. sp. fusiforme G11]|uniref:GAF domain-containing protein n=1 Tax=Cronartium quercuum f. sp. fusiforme G11 TaxID=708437 RepID=A0A9P6NLR3_9BASI|nr:hypothetical protein CROQUDRAFT_131337 [Cronartium quercuum f. sp. fusiforme G11]
MSDIIASPFGYGLPYASLFAVPRKTVPKRRPAEYFWEKAIAAPLPPAPAPAAPELNHDDHMNRTETNSTWLDHNSAALSESENEEDIYRVQPIKKSAKKIKSFARMRHIAFRAFIPKAGSNKPSTVVSTEIISQQQHVSNIYEKDGKSSSGFTIFNSWRIKSKGAKTQAKKLVAVVRTRISSKSPADQHPKTWEEYHTSYAAEQIDILDPPPPPVGPDGDKPSPAETRLYMPPRPHNEAVRQLVVNRLGVFGKNAFDGSEEAAARARQRTELAEQLEEEGKAPTTLEHEWDRTSTGSRSVADLSIDATRTMVAGVRSGQLPPETLEQHPVFRKIVKQCREMFGTSISMLTIMDEDRQIFLAESGLGGMREVSRDVTFCAHTILSGRKGFTILDTHEDWRFHTGPLVTEYGSRFYAGVPLMAPNLDGRPESDMGSCPLGTLCVVDDKPRDAFGVEERKKLVYMAEYARREIELWFKAKMAHKMDLLEESHQKFVKEAQDTNSLSEKSSEQPEELAEPLSTVNEHTKLERPEPEKRNSFVRLKSKTSSVSNLSTMSPPVIEPSSKPPATVRPGLFDEGSPGLHPKLKKVFDLATTLVGSTLDLSLVYLIAVVPDESLEKGRTFILAGYNLPSPLPTFDVSLHLRVLHANEGGLLYQNPSVGQSKELSLNPRTSDGSDSIYASAMLVRVGKEPESGQGGFVLAGFTNDPKRVFGSEDVHYLQQFGNELNRYTLKCPL